MFLVVCRENPQKPIKGCSKHIGNSGITKVLTINYDETEKSFLIKYPSL